VDEPGVGIHSSQFGWRNVMNSMIVDRSCDLELSIADDATDPSLLKSSKVFLFFFFFVGVVTIS